MLVPDDEFIIEESPPKKYGIIVADPPWRFSDNLKYEKRDSTVRGVNLMYPTLNLTEIKKLPVGELAAENALCALWVPSAFLKAGLDVLEAWGFEYKQLWIWGKTSKKNPLNLAFGMGRLARNCHEPCLIGIKGKYTPFLEDRSQRNMFMHPSLKHSQKPESIQTSLDKMFPNWDKLELFARRDRSGWTCVGNEAPGTPDEDIRDSIGNLLGYPLRGTRLNSE
jgi:N6-adenosine-specific RNA methylase IME4